MPSVSAPQVPSHPASPLALFSATTPMAMAPLTLPGASDLSAAHVRCDLAEPAGTRQDGTALSPVPTAPPPASPPHPRDHSAGGTHLRDSGGGNAPLMGTVPSSWRPELTAAAVPPPADASTPGRTVRYSGPPS
ncbi:hypothetical protein [Actinoplanes aureus]|uniref:Uncharacterized protein n=1 Tax=Actinoplanes aureus TaxID=2792083 RepID=A0A931CAQ6_9ACTN|nr:hypothetical protein [Actinoplanes aureus]MBG0561415.1 hypothetical protein [Actinoplanes aureus]